MAIKITMDVENTKLVYLNENKFPPCAPVPLFYSLSTKRTSLILNYYYNVSPT